MSILLPKFLAAFKHAETIATCREIQDVEDEVVGIDARHLVFVDPFALTLLGATLYELKQWNQRIQVSSLAPHIGGYLRRMDLFGDVEFIGCEPPAGRRQNRWDSLVELTQIEQRDEAAEAARRITHAMVGRGGAPHVHGADPAMDAASPAQRLSQLIQYVLSELLENAVTHARRHGFRGKARVWVAAQYYPTNDRVRLAVTDTGCGFLETLRKHPDLGTQSHFSAILAAMKPRVSCNRDLGISSETVNQGVGLTTVARIARLAEGRTLIVSGDAYHDPPRHGGRMPSAVFWQGVSVAMELRRDQLQRVQIADALPEIETSRKISPRFE